MAQAKIKTELLTPSLGVTEYPSETRMVAEQYAIGFAQGKFCPVYQLNCMSNCVCFEARQTQDSGQVFCNHFNIVIAERKYADA